MRITRYIAMAAMAASVLLSCTKVEGDNTSGTTENPQERIITISYAGTRTAVDGLAVTFKVGDEIMLYNGSASQVVKVSESPEGVQYLSTTLTGTLSAVYPAKYAVVSDKSLTYGVPSEQTGRFEDADICMATGITDNADFTTQVSILRFYVDESIGVSKIEIEGTGVASDGDKITIEAASGKTLYDVGGSADERICYAAVCPVSGKDITLTGTAANSQVQTREIGSVSLSGGYIYNAFIPYYIDLGDAGKWGYCNIGAFLPEEVGLYFAWGDTVGYKPDDHDFSASNAPYLDYYDDGLEECFYTKYNETDGLSVLKSEDDAANKHWGDNWRMPTYEDVNTLMKGETMLNVGFVHSSYSYFVLSLDDKVSLCFPMSGNIGEGNEVDFSESDYWISTVDNTDTGYAFYFMINAISDFVYKLRFDDDSWLRYNGYNIRPIWGEASEPDEPDINITGGSFDLMGKIYF